MQMATVTVVGGSGYTGQETLDRVLHHPDLQLHAVGSDSLAGREAAALDPRLNRNGGRRVPRFITNDAAIACGADITFLCLSHDEAAGSRRRREASLSTSPAAIAFSTRPSTRSGTGSRIHGRASCRGGAMRFPS